MRHQHHTHAVSGTLLLCGASLWQNKRKDWQTQALGGQMTCNSDKRDSHLFQCATTRAVIKRICTVLKENAMSSVGGGATKLYAVSWFDYKQRQKGGNQGMRVPNAHVVYRELEDVRPLNRLK
ncbi:hypothetical protein CBL_01241 [Carabus blaptoides fortunei]